MDISSYTEFDYSLVNSNHGSNLFYRVSFGCYNILNKADGTETGIIIFMQKGKSKEWSNAAEEIALELPTHILTIDIIDVVNAVKDLSSRIESV